MTIVHHDDPAAPVPNQGNSCLAEILAQSGEHLPYAIAVLRAPDFRYEYINSHYQAIAPGKNMLGRTFAEVWPEVAADCLPSLRSVAETGVPFHESNVRYNVCRVPGFPPEPIRATYSWISIPSTDGAPSAILAVGAETPDPSIIALTSAQQAKTVRLLAGGIAHDFNNLLTTMLGYAWLGLASEAAGSRAAGYFAAIRQSADHAAALTRQMLAYSGQGRTYIQSIKLSSFTTETLRLLKHSIPGNIRLEFDLLPDPPELHADSRQMEQLITNLVLNAVEAIDGQPGVITLRTTALELTGSRIRTEFQAYDLQPGVFVCLEVEDTGCGIAAEILPRIFEPFFTTHFTGRGLGLAAVDGIVRASQGAIQVVTNPGLGSTFRIFLPVALLAASSETTGH